MTRFTDRSSCYSYVTWKELLKERLPQSGPWKLLWFGLNQECCS